MSFGLMGGDMQPQGHVQVLTDIIDFGMNVQEAGDAARWRHYGGAEVDRRAVDRHRHSRDGERLRSGGEGASSRHAATRSPPGTGNFGGYQAIMWDAKNHVYWGASEMRKDGEAAGY